MCLYPKLIKNRKYGVTKKNGGNVPQMKDDRVQWVAVGCGNCIECRKQYARGWQIRLQEEIKTNTEGKFITLTFNNEELKKLSEETEAGESNAVATLAMRRFLERWRKKYKKSVKHWFATELGHQGTERIHLHGILFTNVDNETIEKLWKYGNIWVGDYVNAKTINYIIKYITKVDNDHKGFKSKILCSKGIGSGFLKTKDFKKKKYKKNDTDESYKLNNGVKVNLPIYYRNKIYTEEERELLWLEKLEKQELYLNGIKYDVSTTELMDKYLKDLEYFKKKNKEYGYGDDGKEYSKKNYNTSLMTINKLRKYNKKSKI